MADRAKSRLPRLLEQHQDQLLKEWMAALPGADQGGRRFEDCAQFVRALQKAVNTGEVQELESAAWAEVTEYLGEMSRAGALKGASPSETATFVFSLKGPLFNLLRREVGKDAEVLSAEIWSATLLLDRLGLYTTEVYQKTREDVIGRQQMELLELSTPVVQLADGILTIPLIGTLDSARTQIIMEHLLQEIVKTGAEIAIIDISGVPTVDTLVAQYLIKTVSAARLMGADCIISGIRPQIAQTMVHLGVDLDVVSKSTMADAIALAFRRTGKVVVSA